MKRQDMCICNESEEECFLRKIRSLRKWQGETQMSCFYHSLSRSLSFCLISHILSLSPSKLGGDWGGRWMTEPLFPLISEDMEKEWLPSVVLRANKDFSTVVPMTRDKCLTEGYSPSRGTLMICSRHTLISLVVHEARWHTWCSGPSVRAQPYVGATISLAGLPL